MKAQFCKGNILSKKNLKSMSLQELGQAIHFNSLISGRAVVEHCIAELHRRDEGLKELAESIRKSG